MEKRYIYDKKRYSIRILGIGYFSVLLALYGIYTIFVSGISVMNAGLIFICLYIIYETFITCANPNEVIISDKKIIFKDPRHTDEYFWSDIKDFRVKELPDRKQVYIRINKDQFDFFKGRYWVYCLYFNDTDELYKFFCNKEMEMHPDTIKAYARRGSKPAEKEDNKKTKGG